MSKRGLEPRTMANMRMMMMMMMMMMMSGRRRRRNKKKKKKKKKKKESYGDELGLFVSFRQGYLSQLMP